MVCFWILHIYWNTLFSLPRPQSQISDFGTSKVSYWSRACPVKNNTTLSEQWASLVRIRLQSRRPGFDPWVGRSPGEGKGYQLQYSGLENSMDYTHGVTKSQTQLSNFHFTFTLLGTHFFYRHTSFMKNWPYIIDPWTTWVWTALVHLYEDFFNE